MEIRANFLLVGGFVLILFAGVIAFTMWLAKVQFDVQFTRYDIVFAGSISGLRVGSSVSYRGIPVGDVIAIGFSPDNVEDIVVTIEVPASTPVKTDTVASIEMQGITGGALIQLSGGTQKADLLQSPLEGERAVIASIPSKLQELFEGAPELVTNFNVLVTRAARLFSDQNLEHVSGILANVDSFTGTLADRGDDVGTLIEDAGQAMDKMRDAMASLERLGDNVNAEVQPISTQAQKTLAAAEYTLNDPDAEFQRLIAQWRSTGQSVEGLADQMEAMVEENRKPIRDFTEEGLYEMSAFIAEAREFVNGLNRLSRDIERDPARFLFGNQQQGYEAGR